VDTQTLEKLFLSLASTKATAFPFGRRLPATTRYCAHEGPHPMSNKPDVLGPNHIRDVILIGSGPAGYTSAVYAARDDPKPVIFEGSVTQGGAPRSRTSPGSRAPSSVLT
jgi:hypothetical protein